MTEFGPSSENGRPWENVTLKVTVLQRIYLPDRATTPAPPNWSRHCPGCHKQPRVCLGRRLNRVIVVGTRQHPGYSRGNRASSARPAERWNVGLLGYEIYKWKLENWRNKSSSGYSRGQSEGGLFLSRMISTFILTIYFIIIFRPGPTGPKIHGVYGR